MSERLGKLYDKPYEDNKRIGVTGPFTVECLRPHRILPANDANEKCPESETVAHRDDTAGSSVNMAIENLRKAGGRTAGSRSISSL